MVEWWNVCQFILNLSKVDHLLYKICLTLLKYVGARYISVFLTIKLKLFINISSFISLFNNVSTIFWVWYTYRKFQIYSHLAIVRNFREQSLQFWQFFLWYGAFHSSHGIVCYSYESSLVFSKIIWLRFGKSLQ